MALVLADRVKESTTTSGTGTLTLAGAQTGYQSFGTAIGNGNTCYYAISATGSALWEVGLGTYTAAGTTLSRDVIFASSSGGTAITLPGTTFDVYVTYAAGYAVYADSTTLAVTESQYIANKGTTGSATQGAFAYGTMGFSDQNVLASFQSSVNNYNQVVIQNTNSGNQASADLILNNNLGTATTYYASLGINSSGWTGTPGTASLNAPNVTYLTATSGDLVLGTTTSNAIRFVTNGGADKLIFDANGNVGIGVVPTGLDLLELGAGTTAKAPLGFTSGPLLTSADTGSVEYDGNNWYVTPTTTEGRTTVVSQQQFILSATGSAIGPAISNYFGANSAASLLASTTYEIQCNCYFLKTTAGTVTWTGAFSSSATIGHGYLEYTPVTGFTTAIITGAMVTAEATAQTISNLAFAATASLTTAVYHVHKLTFRVTTNLACNFRLNITQSAGTVTPQAGSWYTVKKLNTTAGNFVA